MSTALDFEVPRNNHYTFFSFVSLLGRPMAQEVSRRPLTTETRIRAQVSPCGICGGQGDTGTSVQFPLSISFHHGSSHSCITWG
jgi:hypothetical protein